MPPRGLNKSTVLQGRRSLLLLAVAALPISSFAVAMGMVGLAIGWIYARDAVNAPAFIGDGIRWLASALYAFLLAMYVAKLVRLPKRVVAEFRHPLSISFFPAISIGMLLLSVAWLSTSPAFARIAWHAGAALQLLFTLFVMNSWINHERYKIGHANPTWFIPVVGNIIVPVAGVRFAPMDVNWFFFSVGLIFWFILMTIVLYRLFFHEPLSSRLTPTLFILIAPPAIGFLAYLALTDSLDALARILYFCASFFALLCAANIIRFVGLCFSISAWAYSFPLAAMTLATFEMSRRTRLPAYADLSLVLLSAVTVVILILLIKTCVLVLKRLHSWRRFATRFRSACT